MQNESVFVGTVAELENESLNDARCRSHSIGTCPRCVEDICPLCNGSGFCTVVAVDHPDQGVLYVDDRKIEVPCVLCKASSGEDKRFPAEEVVIEPDMLEFAISDEAGPQVQATINPLAHFRWIAPPGHELKMVIEFEIRLKRKDGTAW